MRRPWVGTLLFNIILGKETRKGRGTSFSRRYSLTPGGALLGQRFGEGENQDWVEESGLQFGSIL